MDEWDGFLSWKGIQRGRSEDGWMDRWILKVDVVSLYLLFSFLLCVICFVLRSTDGDTEIGRRHS